MKKLAGVTAIAMLLMAFSGVVCGQEKDTAAKDAAAKETKEAAPKEQAKPREFPVYKLDFVVAEVENGKRVNSRNYMMMLQANYRPGRVSMSTRVPVQTGVGSWQYMDVGLSLLYSLHEEGDFVVLEGSTNIDSFAVQDQIKQTTETGGRPITRRVGSECTAALVPGKPTIISSIDDTNSNKQYEVQVTATKIK